jgi:predicted transcriptional regulator
MSAAMPNLSVKIDDATRKRLHDAAARQGQSPHALMVKAINIELVRLEQQDAFVARALAARERAVMSGVAIDGPSFAHYLRKRAGGETTARPLPVDFLASPVSEA